MISKTQAVIDRCLRIGLFDKTTGNMAVMMPEVEDFQLSVTIENEKTATSASGATVATFEDGKQGEISGTASFFNFQLMAAQSGSEAEEASDESKIDTPRCDVITISKNTAKLTQKAKGTVGDEIGAIYTILPDGGAGAILEQGATAEAPNQFKYDAADQTITVNESVQDGTQFYVYYTYESPTAIHIVEDADAFAKAYIMRAEVLTYNVCNQSEKTTMMIVANNAKLSTARDVQFTTDGKHPFTLNCQTDYCGAAGQKRLFEIFVPEE